MKLFPLNKRMLIYIGLCNFRDHKNRYKSTMFSIFGVSIFIILTCANLSSVVYIAKDGPSIEGTFDQNVQKISYFSPQTTSIYEHRQTVCSLPSCVFIVWYVHDGVNCSPSRRAPRNIYSISFSLQFKYYANLPMKMTIFWLNSVIKFISVKIPASLDNFQKISALSDMISMFFIKFVICGYFILSMTIFILDILYCTFIDGYMNPDHLFIPYKFS